MDMNFGEGHNLTTTQGNFKFKLNLNCSTIGIQTTVIIVI